MAATESTPRAQVGPLDEWYVARDGISKIGGPAPGAIVSGPYCTLQEARQNCSDGMRVWRFAYDDTFAADLLKPNLEGSHHG